MISICVPTYEMKGKGDAYLEELIHSVRSQTYKDYEIVISDHSKDDSIKNVADRITDMNIKYHRCETNLGNIATNINNAIDNATGSHIKFLLQDDYFYTEHSLQLEVNNLGDDIWGFCSTIHKKGDIFTWHLIPEYHDNVYLGANSIGSPSLMICKRESCLKFDENLVLLVDCDFYRMMYEKYGKPKTTSEISVVSRVWDGQHQKTIDEVLKNKEVEYVKSKYV